MLKNLFILCFLAISCALPVNTTCEGFVADTLVHTPTGYARIQDLVVGDDVIAYEARLHDNNSDQCITAQITHITCHDVKHVIQLHVNNQVIQLAPDQLLFDPLCQSWIAAGHIQEGQYLLCAPLHIVQVQSVAILDQETCMYSLSLNNYHTYRVGSCNVIAHNYAPLGAALCAAPVAEGGGVFAAFLAANPLVAPVTISVGSAGLVGYGLWKLISGIKESKKACKKNKDKGNKHGLPDGPENNKPSDEITPDGVAAIALLKAIDKSKDKATEVFNRTCEWLQSSDGLKTVAHCFFNRPRHNFGPLLARVGANTADEVLNQVRQTKILIDVTQQLVDMGTRLAVDAIGVFSGVILEYEGELITVQGRVIEGMIKISTMFIKPQHVR